MANCWEEGTGEHTATCFISNNGPVFVVCRMEPEMLNRGLRSQRSL